MTRHAERPSSEAGHDLAIILVSYQGERWLPACLESIFAHAGDIDLDVVVSNNADDGTHAIVRTTFRPFASSAVRIAASLMPTTVHW